MFTFSFSRKISKEFPRINPIRPKREFLEVRKKASKTKSKVSLKTVACLRFPFFFLRFLQLAIKQLNLGQDIHGLCSDFKFNLFSFPGFDYSCEYLSSSSDSEAENSNDDDEDEDAAAERITLNEDSSSLLEEIHRRSRHNSKGADVQINLEKTLQ